MNRLLRYIIILSPFGYMLLIWTLSSMPSNAVVNFGFSFDDLIRESLHLVEFGILYVLIVIALLALGKSNSKSAPGNFQLSEIKLSKVELIAIIISVLYSITDEIHQSFIPYRTASLFDLIKDWVGVGAAYFLLRFYYKNEMSKFNKLVKKLKAYIR